MMFKIDQRMELQKESESAILLIEIPFYQEEI